MIRRRYDSVKMVFVFAAVAIVALVMLIDEAVLVKIQESDDNNAFIVRAGNRGELADAQKIRILLRQQDLHDDVYRVLTESGFTLKDNSEYTIMKKDSKIRWIKIQRETARNGMGDGLCG